jgi:trans-aconitate methyltransferase
LISQSKAYLPPETVRPVLYSSRTAYHIAMRLLYGRHFNERYAAIAAHIPTGSAVVDVCAGDCYLYLSFLRDKSVSYIGLDISPALVRWAQQRGVQARVFNLWQDDPPGGDVLVMQASLYQFAPQAQRVVERLLAAARDRVIIAEPIRNLSASSHRALAALSRRLTAPAPDAHGYSGQRFDRASLIALFRSFESFEESLVIAGGKEMMGLFTGKRRN